MIARELPLFNVPDIIAAMVRMAIMDALGDDPIAAYQARWWLDQAGMLHLLTRPEAAQFTPSARKRPRTPIAAAAARGV